MPLANGVIARLNEITAMIPDKERIGAPEEGIVRDVFREILAGGDAVRYDVSEIGSWLANEGSWDSPGVRDRITDIARDVLDRYGRP